MIESVYPEMRVTYVPGSDEVLKPLNVAVTPDLMSTGAVGYEGADSTVDPSLHFPMRV